MSSTLNVNFKCKHMKKYSITLNLNLINSKWIYECKYSSGEMRSDNVHQITDEQNVTK